MKKNVLILFTFIVASFVYSQVGIGTENPNPDALLEIDATTQQGGLLLPRVALVSTTAAAPLTAHVQGMTLYNTATTTGENAVSPGYYYNDGSQWVQINAADGGGNIGDVWSMQGNAASNPATDFIGTIDAQPLVFKVNNTRAGFLDHREFGSLSLGWNAGNPNNTGKQNVGIGENALRLNTTGQNNTALGASSLRTNTTGQNNTALGLNTLYRNTTGNFNTAVGYIALLSNTTGRDNTALGAEALFFNTTGDNNIAVGVNSLRLNITGNNNAALGIFSLRSNTEGNSNVALGAQALYNNTIGNFNVGTGYATMNRNTTGSNNNALGAYALYLNTLGSLNVAFGHQSLYYNTTGNFNTALGAGAGVTSGDLQNATAIGYDAKVNASNKVRIGNSEVTVIEGQVPFTTPSDARFKSNVQYNVPGLAFINQLQPVTYYFDNQKMSRQLGEASKDQPSASKKIQTGFLAQDVEKAAQTLNYSFDGLHAPENADDYYTLSYSQFVVPLVQAVKEQQEMIEAQQALIKDLQNEMAEMKSQLNP